MNQNAGEALLVSEGSEEVFSISSDALMAGELDAPAGSARLRSCAGAGGAFALAEAEDTGPDPESAEQVRAAREDAARRRRAALTEKGHAEPRGEVMPEEEESPLSRVARVVMPMGRLSRRVVAGLALVGGIGAMLLMGMGSDQHRAPRTISATAGSAPEQNGEPGSISAGETIAHDETLRSTQDDRYRSRQPLFSNRVEVVEEGSTVAANHAVPAVTAPNSATPPAVKEPTPEGPGRERGRYAVVMRAGEARERGAASGTQEVENGEAKAGETAARGLRAGTRIPMTLLEPLQSGMATTVEARVDTDVRDGEGLVLERGTKLMLPFPGTQTNGRMPCGSDPVTVRLADGRNLVFVAVVKGPDLLSGLPGKVTRTGSGSRLTKVARGMGQAAGGAARAVIGRTTGGYGVYSGNIAIEDAAAERYERAPKEVVTVPAGLHFTLILREAAYISK